MPYPFLDRTCAELVAGGAAITFYCRCGRYFEIRSSDFGRWPESSLHGVARRLKCSGCGALGAVDSVIVNPEHTGPAWAR